MDKSNIRRFYVYEHWRPDKGVPFYVGKGHGRRAHLFNRRYNSHYDSVVKKLAQLGMGVEVRLAARGLTEFEAFALEIKQIAFYREQGIKLTNATNGGEGFSDPTGETAKKISAALTGKKTGPRNLGRKASAETRAKISAGNKRRFLSDESRAKMSASLTGRKHSAEAKAKMAATVRRSGWKHSPETKAKIGAANIGRLCPKTDAMRANMSAAKLGKPLSAAHKASIASANLGHVVSPETRAKISATKKRLFRDAIPPNQLN